MYIWYHLSLLLHPFPTRRSSDLSKQTEANIAAQLSRVGIKVKVDSVPKAIFYSKLAGHKLDFYIFGWFDGAYDFGRDRKSTRLNSSHVAISYAVFCLKYKMYRHI